MTSNKTLNIVIDPSGAETGGRVVKRTIEEVAAAAAKAEQSVQSLSAKSGRAMRAVGVSAQGASRDMRDFSASADYAGRAYSAMATNMSRTASLAAFQRRNLIFQLNDVAVSLASGMNPLMVMAQQGSQISQIYAGQGGVVAALRETGKMAGEAATRFGRWGAVLAPVALGLSHIKTEAESALHSSVSWGEVMTATFQTIRDALQNTFGPAVSTIVDPLIYAFGKLQSAAVDVAELVINSFRAAGVDVAFVWDQLPNIVGGAFVGAVNVAIDHLNKLVNASKEAVNQIIGAFNKIPGVDLSMLDTSGQTIQRLENTYATDLTTAAQEHAARQRAIMSSQPLREGAGNIVDRIGANRARSGLADLANMDFSKSIQGATSLGQAIGSIATAASQASTTVVDVNQQIMDARRQTLTSFEQTGNQLRSMKTELSDIQKTLAAAAQTPVSDIFGDSIGQEAAGAIEAAASSIQKVFKALDGGQITAKTAHESLELVRASLQQIGGDKKSIDSFVDALINGNIRVRDLESGVKSLSQSILNIPDKIVSIGIQQYNVPSAGGGTANVNVIGGNADMRAQQYTINGQAHTVYGGNGNYSTNTSGLIDAYDYAMMNATLGYGGARAAGGPVASGGTYLVGEEGPELVTMGGAGMVANTNSTASILSGGRDTLSLIEDHLYSIMQEVRIHTGYWETADSNDLEIIACLKQIKSVAAASASYSSGGGSSSSSGRGSGYGSGYGSTNGSAMPYSGVDFSSVYNFMGIGSYNGTGAIGYDTYGISPAVHGTNTGMRDLHTPYFATGGQIMPGEDQKVELFKKNSERVIIIDDSKVTDGTQGKNTGKSAERPIQIINHFHNANIGDARSRQAMEDQFRRAILQTVRS
ncbi:phage tape measure domain-containing protein [Rhizobium etli 8C-3]|uniref:Phage tape measure domain-containing protein n=1 Tax=Rhizobium etli 8C-3 TaxID=538025 RepID=A0A1L5P329_RHIET|nr:phage tail length tape measure family protein [Rhizobium etli]APO74574.1 phage tape measure domain-containing protein [Rhizobium etli 8C-3]